VTGRTHSATPPVPARIILAFDYGARRIGLASGDTLTRTAAPRAVVPVRGSGPDWVQIARHIAELAPALLVVGAPYNADGSVSALTQAARAFCGELRARFALPVQQVDERFSSLEASAALAAQRQSGARRRRVSHADIDGAAAAVILERWLAAQPERPGGTQGT
jgi:putative holliday junction resolvase